MGKTLAAGYFPVSAIVTSSKIGNTIKKEFGSIQFSTTHQGHSLGVAASFAVQKIINNFPKYIYFRKIIITNTAFLLWIITTLFNLIFSIFLQLPHMIDDLIFFFLIFIHFLIIFRRQYPLETIFTCFVYKFIFLFSFFFIYKNKIKRPSF